MNPQIAAMLAAAGRAVESFPADFANALRLNKVSCMRVAALCACMKDAAMCTRQGFALPAHTVVTAPEPVQHTSIEGSLPCFP